jgi:uncharacterized protein
MPADVVALVGTISRALADDPDAVTVTESTRGRRHIVRLHVAPGDMGRIIGREGRVANAIRALLVAATGDESWSLEIGD